MISRLSHSTVSDFADCGEKVRLKKVERVIPIPSWALVGGSAVHEVTENRDLENSGYWMEGFPLTFAEAFDDEIEARLAESDIPLSQWRTSGKPSKGYPNKEDELWWRHNGQSFVDKWRRFLQNSPYQIATLPNSGGPAIEVETTGTIGDAPFKGFIDRVLEDPSGNLYVVDLKTGTRQPKPSQLLTYRIILNQLYEGEFTPKYGFYYMTRTGMTEVINLEALDDGSTEYEYAKIWRAVQEGIFIPNRISGWCHTCDVAKYCYAVQGEKSQSVLPWRAPQ